LLQRRLRAKNDIPSFHGDVALRLRCSRNVRVAQNSLGTGQAVHGQALAAGHYSLNEHPEHGLGEASGKSATDDVPFRQFSGSLRVAIGVLVAA
jgi:hypothetical protein